MFIGIDPAWKTYAYCVLDQDGRYIHSEVLDPSSMRQGEIPDHISTWISNSEMQRAAMERFVYFKGRHTANSEDILMVIGQTQREMYIDQVACDMYRSVEWKTALVKYLRQEFGFRNPSDSLDKVFSLAAAKCCLGIDFNTDHEADAGCLAYLAWMRHNA